MLLVSMSFFMQYIVVSLEKTLDTNFLNGNLCVKGVFSTTAYEEKYYKQIKTVYYTAGIKQRCSLVA